MCIKYPVGKYRLVAVCMAILVGLCLIVSFPAASRAEITASATLNTTSFAVDDNAQLTITVNDTRSADLQIPETENFDIYQRGRSSQFNMINGRISSSVTFTCLISSSQPGHYTIPPITINTDGKKLTTEAIPFEVTAAPQTAAGSGTAASPPAGSAAGTNGRTAFITLTGVTPQSYIGEVIPVMIKAYFQEGMRVNLSSAPTLTGDGPVMPQLNDQPVQSREILKGVAYSVLTWKSTLSNIKEGKHTIRLELEATRLVPQRRTTTSIFGGPSPFDDDLFDSVFGGYKQTPLKIASEDISLEILPLPDEGRPENFTGAIGEFSLQATAEPLKAETGEPLTLTLTVKGTGNFDRVEPPPFPDSQDWKTYSPSTRFNAQDDLNVSGEKIFEQAIVAKSPTITEIPSLSFSYFEPRQGVYVTRTTPPIPAIISGSAEASPAPAPAPVGTVTTPSLQQPATPPETIAGLAPLHLEAGTPVKVIRPLYRKPIFSVVVALCLLTLCIIAGYKLYRMRIQGNPEDRRRQHLVKTLNESLASVENALTSADSPAFLAACRTTIQNILGNLRQCEPGTITRADLARYLPDSPELLEIFTVAEQAAYGGMVLSREDMKKYAEKLKTELEKLI